MDKKTGKNRKRIHMMFVLLAVCLLAFAAGRQYLGSYTASPLIPVSAQADFALMAEAWNTIQRFYVDRAALKSAPLTYSAITGMVDALGDTGHSTFLTPAMVQDQQRLTEGVYKGIGAEVKVRDRHVVVVAPIDGSPAQQAGLRPGDILLKADGFDLSNLPLTEAVKHISGPAGTRVTLTVLNPQTDDIRVVTLRRATITVNNVRWKRLPGTDIVQLRIAGFSRNVSRDLRTAIHEIRRREVKGLIFDLRNDPGGVFDEAVDCTSQFLSKGNVLLEKDARGEISPVPVKPGGDATDIPLAVLINGGTASSAEIVAGAIQDAGRGKLVGEKTFGTGTILSPFRLSDGSELLLAVREWLTPNGHVIWHRGIMPDLVVSLPNGVQPLFPEEAGTLSAAELQNCNDTQLIAALNLLLKTRSKP